MANTIKIKRGSNANLPSLNEAELAFTTDTKQLYAGTTSGNKELFKDIPFPTGGLTGELLVKKSDADYDAEWQDLLNKVIYKRRIMVGDNLDNRTIYFTFPDDYVPTTIGTMGHAIISGQYSSIWEQPYSNDPMDTEILISGLGLLRTIYKPKDSSAKLTSTDIGVEEIGEVTAIDDSNPSYRHCYITDPHLKPLQVGDKLVNGTKLYFNFPDDFSSKLSESESYNIVDEYGDTIIYISKNIVQTQFSDLDFIYLNDSGVGEFTNKSVTTFDAFSSTVSQIEGDLFQQYVFVDKTTLGA